MSEVRDQDYGTYPNDDANGVGWLIELARGAWRPDWHKQAACRDLTPEHFYPEDREGVVNAQKVCSGCPVRDECDHYALNNREKYGVWAGKSERTRRTERGQNPRLPVTHCPNDHEYTPENTLYRSNGSRRCKTCRNVSKRAWRARQEAA